MLTPQEISEREFVKAVFGGYDMTGVDDFLELVTSDYSALYKENAILKSKIKVLVEKVEEYRSTEDAMRMALLTAQKESEKLITDAHKQKAGLLADADREIKEKLKDTHALMADEDARLAAAKDETVKFVTASQEVIARYTEFLSRLHEISRAPSPVPAEPTREERIVDTAKQISDAVERRIGAGETEAQAYDDEAEPTKNYRRKSESADPLEDTSPRPKFDFDNLKFGVNFTDDD
ncbi:MAG: DivIVA domain-containing protein [Oscillospiraceae bacterium]|jgi:cell division initiation protein|nr:DivIVA domain-containing protein [Oscillospiraceae bacterium]